MATVTPPTRPAARDLARDQQKVRSPLTQLRGYIRSYVSLEGLALCLLYLALWFWIGLVLDYGFFRAFTVDWVQDMPWGFRAGILVILSAGLLAAVGLTVIKRLFREFSDPAVAIVLERRFPAQLGDRLITAVELSDPQQAAAHGYSAAMVEETIHEAADRVSQVPVREVFNWRRLYRRAGLFLLLSVGLYLLCVGTVSAVRAAFGQPAAGGVAEVNEVSTIWFERNVLLRNTIWPRRAHLELVGFPDDLRVAKDTAPPALRVRAWKYVLADGDAPEGWRQLTWDDVRERGDLFGGDAPAAPSDWKPRDPERGLTVDEVELRLDQFEVRRRVPGPDEPEGWYVATASEESGYRPLQWADLTADRLGGLPVPKLPGDWDPKAWPMLGAGTLGAGSGQSAALGMVARRVVGPKYVRLNVQQVQEQLEKRRASLEKDKAGRELVADIEHVLDRLKLLAQLRATLDDIDARTQDTAMRRTVRRLTVPPALTLEYRETTNRKDYSVPMLRGVDNEYTGNFGELKETVTFVVRGEDYLTPRKTITVVELPKLDRLLSEEDRPAYLYYRADPDAVDDKGNVKPGMEEAVSAADLRGKKQPFAGKAVPVVGGDTSTLEAFYGSTVTLTGTVTKPLARAAVLRPVKGRKDAVEELEIEEGNSFRIKLGDVRREQRFTIEFTDEDGVKGRRVVVVQPIEDTPPRVRDFGPDDVIRRTKEGYMVSASARIPFKGVAGDKQGLARVRYAYTVGRGDFLVVQKIQQALPLVPAVLLLGTPGSFWGGVARAYKAQRDAASLEAEGAEQTQYLDVEGFLRELRSRRLEDSRPEVLERKTVLGLLGERVKEPFRTLLRDYALRPDAWTEEDKEKDDPRSWVRADAALVLNDLPLWKLRYYDREENKWVPLKEREETKPQRRYQLEVWLEAVDTDAEGEQGPDGTPQPHLTPSGEKFTFVVVPDNELLAKIGEEEDAKRTELMKIYKPLDESQQRLTKMSFDLNSGTPSGADVAAMAVRAATIDAEVLSKAQGDTKAVYAAYERILREMRTNQLREDLTTKIYKTVVKPLAEIDAGHFDRTRAAMQALHKALDDPDRSPAARIEAGRERMTTAKKELAELLRKMQDVLAAMQGISDLNAILAIVLDIERNERDLGGLYKQLLEDAVRKALSGDESKK